MDRFVSFLPWLLLAISMMKFPFPNPVTAMVHHYQQSTGEAPKTAPVVKPADPADVKAAPATGPAPETPDHVSAPPKLKEEDRAKIFELQKKAMADQVRIDQIMQQATAQMQRLQQEMQNYSKQIDSAMEAAIKNAGVDKTSWQLNVDTLEFTPSKPNPPAAPPKPPKQ